MPDLDLELEAELRRLQLRALSQACQHKIGLVLSAETSRAPRSEHTSANGPLLLLRRCGAWSCAAIFLFGLGWLSLHPPVQQDRSRAVFTPAGADTLVVKSIDEGLVRLSDGTAARRIRITSIDTMTWTDPLTKASLRWTVPREDVRIIPVQTY